MHMDLDTPQTDVTLVSCDPLPEPDLDMRPLLEALASAGLSARVEVWTDREVDWSASRLTLLRSTWDYYKQADRFRAWIDAVSRVTRLHNPAEIVHWNLDKRYLKELEDRGLSTVPTLFVSQGGSVSPDELPASDSTDQYVVKPTVSAGSFNTHVIRAEDPGLANELLKERAMMIQPYITSVDDYGERSLIFIDGVFSHCVRKAPRFAEDEESITGPLEPTQTELDLAENALRLFDTLLYARADIVKSHTGQAMIAELELVEPSLFFRFGERSAAQLASAIARRLSRK